MEWTHLIFHVILVFHSYTTEAQSETTTTTTTSSSPSLETTTLLTNNLTIMFVGFLSAITFMSLFALFLRRCSSSYTYNTNLIVNLFRRRFNRQAIDKCPIMVYSTIKDRKIGKNTLECAICLNNFQHKDKIRLLPKCEHIFHQDCIDFWLLSNMNCPICRSKLKPVREIAIPIIATTTESGREFSEEPQEQSNTVVDKLPFMGSHSTGHSLPAAWSSKRVCYRSNDK